MAAKTLSYRGFARQATRRNLKRALPYVAGGVAVGAAVWLVARNWEMLSDLVQEWMPLKGKTGQAESSIGAAENKPYPVEHTSKKHSKSHAMFKDVQKISHV